MLKVKAAVELTETSSSLWKHNHSFFVVRGCFLESSGVGESCRSTSDMNPTKENGLDVFILSPEGSMKSVVPS